MSNTNVAKVIDTQAIETDQVNQRIDEFCNTLDSKVVEFCYLYAGGIAKTSAFIQSHGYNNLVQCNKILINSKATQFISLLRQNSEQHLNNQLNMSKTQRIEHLLKTALTAHSRYISTDKAAHAVVYLKAMSVINTMTGDNAPTEVHHLVNVSHQQLEDMTQSERTEAYKRMMSGKLKIINDDGTTAGLQPTQAKPQRVLIDDAMVGEYSTVDNDDD